MASRAADEERAQCAASPPASPTPSTASTSRTSLLDSERHQRRDDNYDDGGDDDDTETTTLRRGLPGKLPSQRHQGSRLAEAPTLLVLRRGTPPSNARSTAVLAWPCRLVTRYVGQQELPFMIQTHWRRRDAAKARANGWNPQ